MLAINTRGQFFNGARLRTLLIRSRLRSVATSNLPHRSLRLIPLKHFPLDDLVAQKAQALAARIGDNCLRLFGFRAVVKIKRVGGGD